MLTSQIQNSDFITSFMQVYYFQLLFIVLSLLILHQCRRQLEHGLHFQKEVVLLDVDEIRFPCNKKYTLLKTNSTIRNVGKQNFFQTICYGT